MMDMFGKLNEMKEKMELVKAKLDTLYVKGTSPGERVTATVTASKKLSDLDIDDTLLFPEHKEELIDHLTIAIGKAMDEAEIVSEKETKSATEGLLPNIPGLNL